MRAARIVLALLAVLAAAAAAAVPASAAPRAAGARLTAFDSCADLTAFARRNAGLARRAVGPGTPARSLARLDPGWRRLPPPAPGDPRALPMPAVAAPAAPGGATAEGAAPPAAAGPDRSSTNVQEGGVDEPDVAKTDATHLFAATGGALQVVDLRPDVPVLVATLPVAGGAGELLVHEDTVLVLGRTDTGTRVTEVDVSDRARPRVARVQDVDGAYVTARLTGTTVRVVTAHRPSVLAQPAVAARRATALQWLPRARFASRRSGRRSFGPAARCAEVRHPAGDFAGLESTTVLTIDVERGLPAVDTDVLMGAAHTVYASPRSLYVATQEAVAPPAGPGVEPPPLTTAVHRFDTSAPGATTYRASGSVRGTLLNQFSLSEHDGVLRAATTEWPLWWGGAPAGPDEGESAVTTLAERDGRLAQVGRVGGLGRGERIYAVRFIGDTGYVVTFRQTDPLYTVDLADPTAPRVLGELKVLGYSAYLHPVGEDLLLGIGQDATEQGLRTGLQLSLFDVSDLRRPARLHHLPVGPRGTSAGVESDHRAFLHWPATRLAVLPAAQLWSPDGSEPFAGAIGFRVGRAEGIGEAGRAAHAVGDRRGLVEGAFVPGGRLLTVSGLGVVTGEPASLAETGWTAFPEPPGGFAPGGGAGPPGPLVAVGVPESAAAPLAPGGRP